MICLKKLLAIGEALIDFVPIETGLGISQVSGFIPKIGGAPANVCGAYVKLGGDSNLITMLGKDPFGDKIIGELTEFGIDCSYVMQTTKACTSLAFVALKEEGNREFSFYRKPGADMLLSQSDIKEEWFRDIFALHFSSVSLGNFPMKQAHDQAISYAKKNGGIISFDPNIRKALWEDEKEIYHVIWEYKKEADIIKISDEELEFITGKTDIRNALDMLLCDATKLVIYTKGSKGAECYTKAKRGATNGIPCNAIDTTGAGDGFIGAFLYKMSKDAVTKDKIEFLQNKKLEEYLNFANRFSANSVEKIGAISSYPNLEEMNIK